jgi:hypothetical protein
MRVAALVLGIAAVILWPVIFLPFPYAYLVSGAGFLACIAGLVVSSKARARARSEDEKDRVANAGFIISVIALIAYVILLINVAIFLPMLWIQ